MYQICIITVRKRSLGLGNIYRPQRSCGQGNVFTGVCLSTGGVEGVCLSACWDARPPPNPGRHPPDQADTPRTRQTSPQTRQTHLPPDQAHTPPDQADTPPGQGRPPPGSRLQHTVYKWPVRMLLECILVSQAFVSPQEVSVRGFLFSRASLSRGSLSGDLSQGGLCPGGRCPGRFSVTETPLGVSSRGVPTPMKGHWIRNTHLPRGQKWLIDTCENITFPKLRWWEVKI